MQHFSIGGLLVALVLCLSLSTCEAAEDMRFADADGDTGYYVDAASIVPLSDAEREATVAVIKAAENRRYLYRMRFNRQVCTYQILSTQVCVYDTKEVLRTSQATEATEAPRPYSITSPMQSIEDFIEELLAKQPKAT